MSESLKSKVMDPSKRPWLAVLAGICFALSFPNWRIAGLAWMAPALLVFSARRERWKTAFGFGWIAGFVWGLMSLHWLAFIPVKVLPVLGLFALSAYIGLYTGAWTVLVTRWLMQLESGSGSSNGWERQRWALLGAVSWVAMEMVLGRFLTGFPWLFLGVSQHGVLPLVQVASWTGVYGVSFLVVWGSLSLLNAAKRLVAEPGRGRSAMMEMVPVGLLLAVVSAWGVSRVMNVMGTRMDDRREIRLALIQPSIPQTVKWDEQANRKAFGEVFRLSQRAALNHPDILVWPEAAVPGYLRYDPVLQKQISGFARQHHLWIVMGADDAEPKAGNPNEADYFNSSFLIDPQGNLVDRYSKQRLVIFGEYIPLVRWLPFLKHLTTIDGGFTPGKGPVTFQLKNPDVRLSVLICFEDVFAHGARSHAGQDVDFLLNLTNDGWFGEGAEQWQHAAIAVYRAVENGLPLVRCTNNGLTCWIDPVGRLLGVPQGDRSQVYRSGFHIVNLPVPVVSGQRQQTFYNRHGDVFGWVCVGVTAWAFAGWWRWRKALKKS